MKYQLTAKYFKFILFLYSKKITEIGFPPVDGPVIFAAHHPNSLLDGVFLATQNRRPIWSMARGDAFRKPKIAKMLDDFKIMAIHRASEGVEHLHKNKSSFDKAEKIIANDGQIVIFSEGICTHQDKVLPLKKGTGRMVADIWTKNDRLQVVPVFTAYDSYDKFGKNMIISYGKPFLKNDFENFEDGPVFYKDFNVKLKSELERLLTRDFPPASIIHSIFYYLGWMVNFPVYLIVKQLVKKKTAGTVFYDSVMVVGMGIVLIPYWVVIWGVIMIFYL